MIKIRRYSILAMIVVFVFIPFTSSALGGLSSPSSTENDPAAMIVDCLIARPMGFASLVLGSASFVVCLPFSSLGQNVDESFEVMVMDPARYTFLRPIGGFWTD